MNCKLEERREWVVQYSMPGTGSRARSPRHQRPLLAVVSHSPPGQDQPRESNFRPSGRNSPFGETCRYNVCRVTPSSPHRPPTTVFGVRGATEQKVYLSPVPACRPAFCLGSSIKPPFYETALTNIRKDRKHPKSGSINSFRQSEFSNQQSHTSKANSNSCLRWFSVPLLPKPQFFHRKRRRAPGRPTAACV